MGLFRRLRARRSVRSTANHRAAFDAVAGHSGAYSDVYGDSDIRLADLAELNREALGSILRALLLRTQLRGLVTEADFREALDNVDRLGLTFPSRGEEGGE